MAFKGINFACSTSPQKCWSFVGTADAMQSVIIQNSTAINVAVGGPDVTSTGLGVVIAPGATLVVPGYYGDVLYIIAASGTPTVQILGNRV